MRLIDADALEKEMYHKSFEVDDGRNKWHSGLWIRYKIFEEAIRDAPTVDAEPVRHGKWEKTSCKWVTYECSECGEKTDETIMGLPRYVYCPMCGARMVEYETD